MYNFCKVTLGEIWTHLYMGWVQTMLYHLITCYWIHILKTQQLNYMFYIFLIDISIFIPIGCNLPFDL